MSNAASDIDNLLARQPELARFEALLMCTFDNATTKLMLLTGTPGEDVASAVKGKAMVRAACDLDDVFQFWKKSRSSLDQFRLF